MTEGTSKLLVIGLDGGTFELLTPLMERGIMPHLADLVASGSWGQLASTVPPFTAAAWASFITGRNPGKHGILTFTRRDRFNYDTSGSGFVNARQFDYTLWELLGDAGKRVGVLNVPLTYPARPVNGFMVTGMMTPPGASRYTYPDDFTGRLDEDYLIDVDFIRDGERFRLQGLPPKTEMLPQIHEMTRRRLKTCTRLFREEHWDFFMVVFTGTDRVSHFFWDDLAPLVAGASPTPLQQALLAYFRGLDDGIGRLVAGAGPEATTFLMSDHGFGPAPTRRLYLNVWLEQLGLLRAREGEGWHDLAYWRMRVGRNKRLKALLRRLLPQSTQDAVTNKTQASGHNEMFDWSQTRTYFVPVYFHVCGIEINLVGERRAGIVKSGAEYEALRDRIIEAARQLRDPATGEPVVDLAGRREELYDGPYVEQFPDIILVLNPDYIGAGSLAGSSLFEPHPDPMRPGEHRAEGIFIAAGPHIVPRSHLSGLNLLDVTPTILYAMGVPVPTTFDGHVLTEIFHPSFLESHPLIVEAPAPHLATAAGGDFSLSEADEAELERRLRGLGYLE